MKQFVRGFLCMVVLSASAHAETITVKVDGMVCAFCATGLEQLFTDEPGVKAVHVDLDASAVHLTTSQPVTDARIKTLVEKAGFEASAIGRQP